MAKTLLLADDSVTIQKVVNISFASEDVTLVTVDNGDDAIERARETRPDLVLADVVMPGKSGYEVCEAIKADPDLAHIPVLLLTGTFEAFDEELAARAGAAGHVSKPFEAQTLVARVNELLAATPPPPPAAAPAEPEPLIAAESIAAPSTGGSSNEDSFDFFDDDLSAASPAATPEPISIDDGDSGFAFGDADLTPIATPAAPSEASVSVEPPAPLIDSPFPDRTVAILPDDPSAPDLNVEPSAIAEPVEVPPTALSADLIDGVFGNPEDELLSIPETGVDDSFVTVDPTSTADDAYDFSFDRDPSDENVASDENELLSVASADVAHTTVIDPNGASGYDVSSSDLGDPFAIAADEAPIAVAEPVDEPIAAPSVADATQFLDLDSLADTPALSDETFAAVEIVAEPGAAELTHETYAQPDETSELDDLEVSQPIFASAPSDDDLPKPLPAESAATTDSVLAEITPQLREEIHDTLEKIAWESFGSITERVVAEVVYRVEKIAWEVIPQLTETLVKAEIRRLKGESDD
jgi:CheY-like chemotaxis protein